MEDSLSLQARNYRLAQSEAERVFLDEAILAIQRDPNQGTLLSYPWQAGARQLVSHGYKFIYIYNVESRHLFIRTIELAPV